MNVWLVEVGEYDDRGIDSIWGVESLADLRAQELNRTQARYRDRVKGEHAHRYPPCGESCRLVSDGASVHEWKVEGMP